MKKFVYGLLALIYSQITLAHIDNDLSSQIQQLYPHFSENSGCRLMKKQQDNNVCIANIITKDFSNKGDYLYLVVLGNTELDGCHVCAGLVDIYAFKRETKLILKASLTGNQLGSWGKAPTDLKFIQKKGGKVVISIEDSFTQGGNVEISKTQFYVSGSEFKYNSQIIP